MLRLLSRSDLKMFKFTVIYLLLLILLALMGALQIDSYNYPHAALGQAVFLVIFWLIGCAIAAVRTKTPEQRAARTAKDKSEATPEG
jgi:hypothetical protein